MKIATVDIETTGFFDFGGLIVEVGIVLLDLETGKTEKIYNELVCEEQFGERHINSWIFKNSDLSFQDVLNAEPLDLISLQKIFDEYPATAYNKDFDFQFLKDRGLKIQELPCPMKICTDICKLPSFNGLGYKYPKVQEAWDYFFGKTNYIEAHRGADDAEHEALIVYELYKNGKFEDKLLTKFQMEVQK